MSEINFNQELFKVAINCKDAKEVFNFAQSKGITMTEEEAGNLFAFAHKGKLTDEELDQIVGGMRGQDGQLMVAQVLTVQVALNEGQLETVTPMPPITAP